MPMVLVAGTWGGTLVGGDLMSHWKLLLIRPRRFSLLLRFGLDQQLCLWVLGALGRGRHRASSSRAVSAAKGQGRPAHGSRGSSERLRSS